MIRHSVSGARIAVIGWYNVQNLGDEILAEALESLFKGCRITFWGYLPPVYILNHFDYIIIGGGSLLPDHPFVKQYSKLRFFLFRPFSLVGVSTKYLGFRKNVEYIIKDCHHFIVRDTDSKLLLGNQPNISVAPDLSWLIPLPISNRKLGAKLSIGINLRDRPGWSSKQEWPVASVAEVVRSQADAVIPLPFFYGHRNDGLTDQDVMNAVDICGPQKVSPTDYQSIDIVVGMRFHSIVLSAQAGIPFITFDYHPKTVAFCRDMGLEEYCIPLADSERLSASLQKIQDEYAEIRRYLIAKHEESKIRADNIYSNFRDAVFEIISYRRTRRKNLQKPVRFTTRIIKNLWKPSQ